MNKKENFVNFYKAYRPRSFGLWKSDIVDAHLEKWCLITDPKKQQVKEHLDECGEGTEGVICYNEDYSKAYIVGRDEVYDCPVAKRLHYLVKKYGKKYRYYGYHIKEVNGRYISVYVYAWAENNVYIKVFPESLNCLTEWNEDAEVIKKEIERHF